MGLTSIRATLIELLARVTPFNLDHDVYNNGINNLYPNEIERVVQNSPTASKGSDLMSKYITGNGLTNDFKLNGVFLSTTAKDIADDISVQYGSYIHVTYGLDSNGDEAKFVPVSLQSLDYSKCRKGKNDDEENAGIITYQNWEVLKTFRFNEEDDDNDKTRWYYPFSNNQEVIKAQILRDNKSQIKNDPNIGMQELLSNYRGQVYYLNLTPKYEYAISHFNSVYNDCDTEYRIGMYSNSISRSGFLGKLAILSTGLDEETSQGIKNDVGQWLGAESSSSVYFLEIEDAENLDNSFKILNVPSQFDERQFSETKNNVRINILGACNNIPSALVYGSESSLFGNSGELIVQMKSFYNEQTSWERKKIEEMFLNFGFDTKIIPLVNNEIQEPIE